MKIGLRTCLLVLLLAWSPLALGLSPVNLGQWIWSPQDQSLFLNAKRAYPDLLPGVWIATLSFSSGEVKSNMALSPGLPKAKSVAVVIRFDDSFHQIWEAMPPTDLSKQIDLRLSDILGHAEGLGVEIQEVQLDYDCPERRLPAWAEALKALSRSSLKSRRVWITSLIAHLKNSGYGDLFRDSVQGHILQVFDTGDALKKHSPETLNEILAGQKMPFRLGLGAFERKFSATTASDHRDWFSTLPVFSSNPWYRGLWIFPGGKPWVGLLEYFERKP